MKLVEPADLKLKKSSKNYLQTLASLPNEILQAGGEWQKIQSLVKHLLPSSPKCWLYTNIKKQDWSVLQTEKLDALSGHETLPVPKFRVLPENYR